MITNRFGSVLNEGDDPYKGDDTLSGITQFMDMIQNSYAFRTGLQTPGLHSRKDIYKECDLPETVNITLSAYKEMYDRNPIAGRVVEVMPEACWSVPPLIYEDEDSETLTEFEEAWEELGKTFLGEENWFDTKQKGHPLWHYLSRIDKLSGIGHFGMILLGLDDEKELHEPIDGFKDPEPDDKSPGPVFVSNEKKKRKLIYISVFGEDSCQTGGIEFESNRHSPRYRKPKFYNIDLGDQNTSDSTVAGREDRTIKVHWSRIVHIADNLGSSDIIGVPRLRPVWNNLLALDKIYNGDGEAFWKNSSPRTYFETHPQLGGDVPVDLDSIRSAVSEMDNGFQKWMMLMGLSAKTVAPQVVAPTPHIDSQIDAICIKLAIPKRKFMGTERGELASGQDEDGWNDVVRGRQNNYCIPRIVVPLVNRLIQIGVLPSPKDVYKAHWPDPDNLTPAEKAALALTRVDAMVKYISGNVSQLMDPMDFLTVELGMEEDEAEQILQRAQKAAEEQAAAAAKEQAKLMKEQAKLAPPGQSPAPGQQPAPGQPPTQGNPPPAKPSIPKAGNTQTPPSPKKSIPQPSLNEEDSIRNEDEYGSWEELSIQDRVVTVNEDTGEIVSVWTENEGNKPLNKPFRTSSGPKKFAVYTKNDKGNVVLVRFGDSDMEIKRDDDERRKSFRARHGCDTDPGPKWKAKYWSCRMWEKGKSVAGVLGNEESVDNGRNPLADLQKAGEWLSQKGLMPGYGQVFVKEGGSGEVWYVGGDGDEDGFESLVKKTLMEVEGINEVTYESEAFPPRDGTWLQVYPKKKEWTTTDNAFCPTGPGGGVDPTCSPGGTRVLKSGEVLVAATMRSDKKWITLDGKLVPKHIRDMKPPIPPAWKDVYINPDPKATVLVQGQDTKGRGQTRYSDSHSAKAAASKFGRVRELRAKRAEIFKEIDQDAKNPDLKENAECLKLVMKTGIRPGGGGDTGADFEAFGATSLKGGHVRVDDAGNVSLSFVPGKSKGKEKSFPIEDPKLAKMLQRRAKKAGPDGSLFDTNPGSLRGYSKSKDGGGFKTKDHRTALGTEVAIAEIKKIGTKTKFTSRSEYKRAVKQVAVKVSDTLGNTPNVALKSYIDPVVFSGWRPPK